ncbi:MAG: hypothetical protein QNJ46_34585 [Leptolyngbyaceae cyanobacterium MO_188.B28]|nr:hypothetical protein [Leptolyngbyaceae cyanobacterium MO_188.B28]
MRKVSPSEAVAYGLIDQVIDQSRLAVGQQQLNESKPITLGQYWGLDYSS